MAQCTNKKSQPVLRSTELYKNRKDLGMPITDQQKDTDKGSTLKEKPILLDHASSW
jgi:hypothetical protein